MIKNVFKIATLLLCIFLFSTCNTSETPPVVDLHIKVSPDTLIIMDKDTLKEIFLSTQPKGKIEYTISQKPDWLAIDSMKGNVYGNIFSLRIKPLKDKLNEGVYKGKINIISDIAGTADVYVIMSVNGHPKIKTDLSEISFPENITEKYITIENSGTGILNWSIQNTTKWMTVSTTSGILVKGGKSVVKVTCNRLNLDQNTFNSSLTITSNSEVTLQPIPVTMVVPERIGTRITPDVVMFDYFQNTSEVYLKNTGNTSLSWTSGSENYYTLTPGSGNIAKGDSVKIKITLDRTSLETGTYKSNITILHNGTPKDTITTQINHFRNTKWLLDRNIIDAEFSKETNRIISISTNPNRLTIIDPDTRTMETINLNSEPRCISVNKNGDHAAIGHNGFITLVNLTSKTIEKEYSVSCNALDIILTSSNWVYVFPTSDQWTNIRCINMITGLESLQTGNSIYAGTVGRLHPSEKYIYGANNGLSPSDIEKYSIEKGTASYLYDSPYHGDYPMNGNLWFSEDGYRIFTKGKTVLKTSTDKPSDMVYNGSLACTGEIRTLVHSQIDDKIFLVSQSGYWSDIVPSSEILVFNYTYLNYLEKYTLEPFLAPYNQTSAKMFNSEGNYVFVNKAGTKLYTINQANKSSGLLQDWAIQNFDIKK